MANIKTSAGAVWTGDLKRGKGTMSSPAGSFRDIQYTAASRFEGEPGPNPEEMIGAAHAACFSMALADVIAKDGHHVERVQTLATVTMEVGGDGARVARVHLETEGLVPDMDENAFKEAAEQAKQNCPVSKLLMPGLDEVTMKATLATELPESSGRGQRA